MAESKREVVELQVQHSAKVEQDRATIEELNLRISELNIQIDEAATTNRKLQGKCGQIARGHGREAAQSSRGPNPLASYSSRVLIPRSRQTQSSLES